jgi:AraC-like DNA-binding protein
MVKFRFKQADFVSWLKQFSRSIETPCPNNYLVLPPHIGKGYIYAGALNTEMSFIIMNFTLHSELVLLREANHALGMVLFFNQVHVGDFFSIRTDQTELVDKTQNRNNIFLSSTLREWELHYSKNSVLQRVGIYFSPVMVRRFIKKDMKLLLAMYVERGNENANQETITFEFKTILDDIFKANFSSDLSKLVLQNRILMLTEKFIHKLITNGLKVKNKQLVKKEDLEQMHEVEKILTRTDLDKFPSIETLSKMAMMSATRLKNKFKEVYGMKIYEYYNRNRLHKAKEMITRNGSTVKEAAYSIGFSNLSNFSRAFKKEFGVLPGSIKS